MGSNPGYLLKSFLLYNVHWSDIFDKIYNYNFQEKVHQDLRLNDQRQKEDPDARARKFFSQLPRSIIIQLYHAYKIDFDMFGYEEPKKYIEMGYILPDESNEIGPPNNDPRKPNLL